MTNWLFTMGNDADAFSKELSDAELLTVVQRMVNEGNDINDGTVFQIRKANYMKVKSDITGRHLRLV